MIEVTTTVEVDMPAARSFDLVANAENNPRWQGGMRSCRWATDEEIHVGSIYHQEARFLGRTIRSTFAVTSFEPGRSITIRTIDSTFPIEVTRSVEPLGADRSLVRAVVAGNASGVFRIAEPVLRRLVAQSVGADYRRLQQLCRAGLGHAGAPPTGATGQGS